MEQLRRCLQRGDDHDLRVAYRSYLPRLWARKAARGCNKLTASSAAAKSAPSAAAGWSALTGPVAILLDPISFSSRALRSGDQEARPPPSREQGIVQEITEGLKAIMQDTRLRAIAGAEFLNHIAFAMFGAVFGLYVIRELDFQPGVLGMIYAVGGVSSLVGALAAGRVASRFGIGRQWSTAWRSWASRCWPSRWRGRHAAAGSSPAAVRRGAFTVYSVNEVTLRQTITRPPQGA
jgi:hypothetical protein